MKMQNALLTAAAAALLQLVASSAGAVPSWAESFGLDGNTPDPFYGIGDDFPLAIAAMPDGGVVVVGQLSYPTNSPAHTYILTTDALIRYAADGTIVWKKALRGDIDNYSTDVGNRLARIVADAQGNIFLASVFKHLDGQGPDITFVAKLNPAGVVMWQKNIGEDTFNSISLAPNGKLVLTSSSGVGGGGGHSYPELTVLDSVTGNAEFIRGYDNSNVQYLQALAGCGSLDGTKYLFSTPANGLTVVLVNAVGDVLDTKNYFNFSIGVSARASIPTSDGDFMVLSGGVIRKIGADQVTVAGVTSTRLVTRFERLIDYPGMGGHTLVQTSDGGYLIGGSIMVGESDLPPNTSGSKAGIYRLNGQGEITRVFAYGGHLNETTYDAETSAGLCSAVPTADGGFAFATDTTSYRNQIDDRKPDWWVVKTDALGLIRNFQNIMVDQTARGSSTPYTDNGSQTVVTFDNLRSFSALGTGPALVLSDPVGNLRIQASPPRIVSVHSAEAIVGQHFAYHIVASFFDGGATITYDAAGLPPGFVLDSGTGVISGIAPPGSETAIPILITLNATDGSTSASPVILGLTIGDGVPVFTVNDSDTPTATVADAVLRFAAKQPGMLAGRIMNVQATTTPNNEASWQKLGNGTNGFMTFDRASQQYVLNSTSYPALNGVYFRAKLTARGHPDDPALVSNVVGPFTLASNTIRAPQILFRIIRNGLRADFDFRAISLSLPSGTAVRVQRSTAPSDEGSWTDLQDGTAGHMIQATVPTRFSLLVNRYAAEDGIYFRAVSSAPGAVDSLSNLIGPYAIAADTPPVVTITSPSGSGTGQDFDHPILISLDLNGAVTFAISGRAASQRVLSRLSILFDGSTINSVNGGATTISQAYTTNRVGDHVIEVMAVDDLGATARAGTGALFVRVVPFASALRTNHASGSAPAVITLSSGKVYTVATEGGVWDDAATWRDAQGNNGVPGSNDLAVIGTSSVRFGLDQTVKSVSINGGHLVGPGNLTILSMITIAGGAIDGYVGLFIQAGAVCELLNSSDIHFNPSPTGQRGVIFNSGSCNIHGAGGVVGADTINNTGQVHWQSPLLSTALLAGGLSLDPRVLAAETIINTATMAAHVVSDDGASLIAQDGGTLIAQDGGTLIAQDGGTLITNDGATVVSENGLGLITNDGGTFKVNNGGQGRSSHQYAPTGFSGFTQTGGQTDLNSIEIIGPVAINGGVLTGSGIIRGDLTINDGYLSPGLIAVTGNYTQSSDGTLIVDAAGGEANQSDQLQIGGNATLGGRLDVRTIGGYVPLANDPFVPIGYASVTGSFASVSQNVQLSSTSTGPLVTIIPGQPNPPTGQPLNISTRMSVQTGDNVLIAGFIVTGPSGSTKQVLIRGIGPSLAASGVPGTLSDPSLQLNKPDGSTVTNDNWQDGDPSAIPPGFAPGDPRESAIVATLAPGAYTAKLSGAHGETGVGLAEVYDLDAASPAKLANISTRGFIDTGDNVMIGGFIIGGTEPARILVRAIGPSLTLFGVAGALSDPILELLDANGSSISNDDWRNTQEEEIIATTIPPTDNREPAILATLVPGNYTAIVRGKNNATGIGLVEVYTLQ